MPNWPRTCCGAWRRAAPTSRWSSAACATRPLGPEGDAGVRALFTNAGAHDGWAAGWRRRLDEEPGEPAARRAAMRTANPAVIPRNHLVEAALSAAVEREDFSPFEELHDILRPGLERYSMPPKPEERVLQTFCGT